MPNQIENRLTMKNFMTVVFQYDDGAEYPQKLMKAFQENVNVEDTKISAISLSAEITKVEQFEDLLLGVEA